MKTYSTIQIARMFNIHPNTVRNYEDLGFIPMPDRKENGYRIFTDLHIAHFRLARTGFEIEIVQNGLRTLVVQLIRTAAKGDYEEAYLLAKEYLLKIQNEQAKAEEAIIIAKEIISGSHGHEEPIRLTRKKAAAYLDVTIDALRNWELNGLLTAKRKENGYRIYNEDDIKILKIIRTLRCADYSLSAILRMLQALSKNSTTDIKQIIDTPKDDEMIISVCDRLLTSLALAEKNATAMIDVVENLLKK